MTPRILSLLAVIGCAALGEIGCAPPPLMCASSGDCPAKASCAAGRCVAFNATPAINTARRLVFAPVDVAYVHRGPREKDPAIVTLGRDDGALLLLRFEAALPAQANVLEAYLLLERADAANEDPGLISLHASRVVDPWSGAGVSWAEQPRLVDDGAPVTRVAHWSTGFVRLDVRDIVNRWRARERGDYGLAVVAEGTSATGIGFALMPSVGDSPGPERSPARGSQSNGSGASGASGASGGGPRLELYVK
jgi:hypothetical protein